MCGVGVAAVAARAVRAGIMASSNGRAIVTPMPRKNVRRSRCFLVMNIRSPSRIPYCFAEATCTWLGAACGTLSIWNGKLWAIPITSVENL